MLVEGSHMSPVTFLIKLFFLIHLRISITFLFYDVMPEQNYN